MRLRDAKWGVGVGGFSGGGGHSCMEMFAQGQDRKG